MEVHYRRIIVSQRLLSERELDSMQLLPLHDNEDEQNLAGAFEEEPNRLTSHLSERQNFMSVFSEEATDLKDDSEPVLMAVRGRDGKALGELWKAVEEAAGRRGKNLITQLDRGRYE